MIGEVRVRKLASSSNTRKWFDQVQDLDWPALLMIALVAATLATLSVLRYRAYSASMFDLGHMSQAIWSSTKGRPLEFSYRGDTISRLALHVELIYFLLTPLYWAFPSPITLLLVQATFFGTGAIPLYCLAKRRIGDHQAARLVMLVYLFYPVAHTAVLFDFHGDTLAMPLLLFAFDALDRSGWKRYWVCVVLALSSKVTVAAPVCALGAFLWLRGHREVGLRTVLLALVWGGVALLVVRRAFATPSAAIEQVHAVGYVKFYFGSLLHELSRTWWLRLIAALLVFAPVLPILIYAPDWGTLALVVALPVLLSSGPGPPYKPICHHYAVVVPFIARATIEAARRISPDLRRLARPKVTRLRHVTWHVALPVAVLMTLVMNVLLVNVPWSPSFWISAGGRSSVLSTYRRSSRDGLKCRWLVSNVPAEASLLISPMLAPHVAHRRELHIAVPMDGTVPPRLDTLLGITDLVVLDGLFEPVGILADDWVGYDWSTLSAALARPEFRLVSAQDGLLVLERSDGQALIPGRERGALALSVRVTHDFGPADVKTLFGDAIGLVEASLTPIAGDRYRLRYAWLALSDLRDGDPWFAVTRLDGVNDARILHLPTIALYPRSEWRLGDLIVEEFEVDLPDHVAPGTYALSVGWYNGSEIYAYRTDERSRIDGTAWVGALAVE